MKTILEAKAGNLSIEARSQVLFSGTVCKGITRELATHADSVSGGLSRREPEVLNFGKLLGDSQLF